MKKLILLLLITFFGYAAEACGNEYGYTLTGKRIDTRYFFLPPHKRTFDTAQIQANLKKLSQKLLTEKKTYEVLSDIAINLMKLGKNDSALKILSKLILEHPDEYNVNANLGTAYELAGKNDSALKYISRGLELNPDSHQGSEWIHKLILEAKIKAKGGNNWFRNTRIISQETVKRRSDTSGRRIARNLFQHQLTYQITTRLPFTPAPDIVLANLLLTLAEFEEEHGTFENAFLAYTYALEFTADPIVLPRIKEKVRKLVEARAKLDIHELPDVFVWMMKLSKIDPSLLVINMPALEQRLDSMNQFQQLSDSLVLLKGQLDSLSEGTEGIQKEDSVGEFEPIPPYVIALITLLLGGLLGWFIRGKNKNSG